MLRILVAVVSLTMTQFPPSNRTPSKLPPVPLALPGYADPDMPLMRAMQAMTDDLVSEEQFSQGTVSTITRCADALWIDWGVPEVNFDHQFQVLLWMRVASATAPTEEREAGREALRDGLLRFHYSGGYQDLAPPHAVPDDYHASMNIARKFLAECLVDAARNDDPEVRSVLQQVVGRMESGVTAYTPELIDQIAPVHGVTAADVARMMASSNERFVERLQTVMGDTTPPEELTAMVETLIGDAKAAFEAVRLRSVDADLQKAAPWLHGDQQHAFGSGSAVASDDPCLGDYQKASPTAMERARTLGRTLRQLARRGTRDPARVEKITKAILKGVGHDCLNQSLLTTLLLAYRCSLSRPGASDSVVHAIDGRLLWLAKDSRKLTTPRHWTLWAEAVSALGPRVSHDLRRFVYHDAEKTETNPVVLKAVRHAQEGLRRSPSSQPATVPTTQPDGTPTIRLS